MSIVESGASDECFDIRNRDLFENRVNGVVGTPKFTEKSWYKLALAPYVWEYCPNSEVLMYIKSEKITKSYMIRKESSYRDVGYFCYMYVKCTGGQIEKIRVQEGVECITKLYEVGIKDGK